MAGHAVGGACGECTRVLAALKELDARFTVQWNDLEKSAEYAEFAASPEHAEWKRFLAAKKR